MTKEKLNEIIRQVSLLGYDWQKTDQEGQYCHFYKGNKMLCILFENGGINTNAYPDIFKAVRNTKEYLSNFDKAEDLDLSGVRGGYKKLLEYNDTVLAMREMKSVNEYEFVTWQYSPDRKSVNYGHYFSDYEAAKEDFSERAGLTDRYKKFSETQLKVIQVL